MGDRAAKRLKVGEDATTMSSIAESMVPGIISAASGMPPVIDVVPKTTSRRKVLSESSDEEEDDADADVETAAAAPIEDTPQCVVQNAIFSVSTAMGISLIGINPYQSELAERVNGVMRHVDFWMKCHGKRVEFTTLDSSSDISPYHLTNAETCHIINFPDKTTLSAKDKAACVVGMYAPKASRAFPFSISSSCILMWSGAEATESVTIEPMAAYRSSIVLACLSNTEGDLGSVYLSPFSFYECKSIRLVAAFAKVVTISSDAFWCCSKNEIIVLVHAYATVRITGKPPPQVTVMAIETGKPPVNLSRVSATDDEYMSITCPCQALVDFDRCFMPCRLVHTPKCSIRKASAPRRSSYVGTITTKGGLPDVTRLFK